MYMYLYNDRFRVEYFLAKIYIEGNYLSYFSYIIYLSLQLSVKSKSY